MARPDKDRSERALTKTDSERAPTKTDFPALAVARCGCAGAAPCASRARYMEGLSSRRKNHRTPILGLTNQCHARYYLVGRKQRPACGARRDRHGPHSDCSRVPIAADGEPLCGNPRYVRPLEPDDYRVRVDLSGLPTDRRAAVADALAVKGFAPGSTAQDLSHVSRVVYSKEDAARAVGHAAAQYLRALSDIYGSLAEALEELSAAETAEESPADLDADLDEDF